MKPEAIKQITDMGWTQSHTATDKGCVFEWNEGTKLYLVVTNEVGVTLSVSVLDKWAVEAGVASVAVDQLFKKLNGMAE